MSLQRGGAVALAGLGAITAYRYQNVRQRELQLPQKLLRLFESAKPSNDNNRNNNKQVVIIGAGVVGVSTAYKLAQRGHSVVVLEPRADPGLECSHCAAGGMSRQNVVVDKDTWIAVGKSLLPHKSNFEFFHINWWQSLSDPFFWRWSWTFTQTSLLMSKSRQEMQQQKLKDMLQFTNYAVQDMVDLLEDPKDDMGVKAGYNKDGSLSVSYDTPKVPAVAKATAGSTADTDDNPPVDPKSKSTLEPHRKITSTDEILKLEPSLKFQKQLPTTAKFEYDVKSASSGRFTQELARRCAVDPKLDVRFEYNTQVKAITTETTGDKPRISQLHTNRGTMPIEKDTHVVVAAGAWTPHVLALMDLYAPVYPLKGYALSVSAREALKTLNLQPQDLPSRINCDQFIYTTRLGDEIRVTSIGEFSEWNTTPTPYVDTKFRQEAYRQFPQLAPLIDKAKTYCGHRPFVADGLLLLGAVDTHSNLYVTCGPGSNGWKLAFGSGEIIARLVSGHSTEDIAKDLGFSVDALGPAGRVKHSPIFAKICRARWNV